jgi:cell division septum initiation protein DivIVA
MGNVNQQIDETRKQVESLLRENQKHGKQLEALETQLERLSVREVVPPPTPAPVGAKPHEGTPTRPAAAATKQPAIIQPAEQIPPQVSCAQVWRQLGQGKPPAAVAQTLGTTVEVIRACEQKIGKGGGR